MSEAAVKHMVDRFLSWRLPDNFRPDGGISFTPMFNEHTAHPMKHEPTGTNLFDVDQATAMVRYMVEGLAARPSPAPIREQPSGSTGGQIVDLVKRHYFVEAVARRWTEYREGFVLHDRDDVEFINTFNPAAVLSLLDALTALAAERDEAQRKYRDEYAIVDRVWRALGITDYAGAKGREISQLVGDLRDRAEKAESDLASLRRDITLILTNPLPPPDDGSSVDFGSGWLSGADALRDAVSHALASLQTQELKPC